ncbi:uncharacterized protein LOC133324760 [Musca vetustissima]|uniref:uncharacterized protein LOC133324760 n=1 Tax=Musca vetustissima TaxID=27455 RepID=UPI002AB755D4|nr:uncharacterized protein LOC133324760 [Musca vetustissima]
MLAGDQVEEQSTKVLELRAAIEVQQDLAVTSTLQTEIVWDVLGPDQGDVLCKKLEYMFPDDRTVYASKQDIRRARRHNVNVKEIRAKLFQNIWQQRKYTNGVLLHSIIYVIVTSDTDVENAKLSHNYSIHPIFRTRRCLNSNSSSGCCMIFIDEQSRIYKNWNDFVKNNELPIGVMVAPANGCYSLDDNNMVQLECCLTPAYHRKSLAKMDAVFSAVSAVGQATTLVHPIFSLLTIGAKTYETLRDYQRMSDKVSHGTATKTSANLNLSGNVICLTSSVATLGAYMVVPNGGALSFTANMSIQAVNSAATLINCTKFILTTYDIFTRYFRDEADLQFSDLMAFGSSLLLLTNSVNNMVITSQLGNIGGNSLRSLLQTNIKAGLSLVAEEAIRFTTQNGNKFDLLRLVNDIPYKDILRTMHTICENLTPTGFLTTISAIGTVVLEMSPGLAVEVTNKEITQLNFIELAKVYGSKFVKHIANSNNLIDVLNGMGIYFSEAVIQLIFNQTRLFVNTCVDVIDEQQNTFLTTEMILFKMFTFAVKNYTNLSYEYLDNKRDELIQGVAEYFQSLNPIPPLSSSSSSDTESGSKRNCDVCGGYYYLVEL